MKGSCSTEPRSPLWKPSVLTTLTGEFVEAMELAMERVCRKWLCVLDVYLDSPDTRTIKVLKALAIGREGGGEVGIGIMIFLPSGEDKDLLCAGVSLYARC